MVQNGICRIVEDVQEDLLELVGVSGSDRKVFRKIQMDADVAHPQVVIAQRKSLFENLVQLHRYALGFMLPGKAQKVLHDAMRALGLFVQFICVLDALWPDLSAGGQELAITENRSERIIQLMRHSGYQLSHRRHILAVE